MRIKFIFRRNLNSIVRSSPPSPLIPITNNYPASSEKKVELNPVLKNPHLFVPQLSDVYIRHVSSDPIAANMQGLPAPTNFHRDAYKCTMQIVNESNRLGIAKSVELALGRLAIERDYKNIPKCLVGWAYSTLIGQCAVRGDFERAWVVYQKMLEHDLSRIYHWEFSGIESQKVKSPSNFLPQVHTNLINAIAEMMKNSPDLPDELHDTMIQRAMSIAEQSGIIMRQISDSIADDKKRASFEDEIKLSKVLRNVLLKIILFKRAKSIEECQEKLAMLNEILVGESKTPFCMNRFRAEIDQVGLTSALQIISSVSNSSTKCFTPEDCPKLIQMTRNVHSMTRSLVSEHERNLIRPDLTYIGSALQCLRDDAKMLKISHLDSKECLMEPRRSMLNALASKLVPFIGAKKDFPQRLENDISIFLETSLVLGNAPAAIAFAEEYLPQYTKQIVNGSAPQIDALNLVFLMRLYISAKAPHLAFQTYDRLLEQGSITRTPLRVVNALLEACRDDMRPLNEGESMIADKIYREFFFKRGVPPSIHSLYFLYCNAKKRMPIPETREYMSRMIKKTLARWHTLASAVKDHPKLSTFLQE